jgi:Family of unknown function (DUF6496)
MARSVARRRVLGCHDGLIPSGAICAGTSFALSPYMAKYGKKAQSKVKRAMHERKHGTLRSGRSGKKVTSRKQAIAIGLSEARRAGGKVPRKRKGGKKR